MQDTRERIRAFRGGTRSEAAAAITAERTRTPGPKARARFLRPTVNGFGRRAEDAERLRLEENQRRDALYRRPLALSDGLAFIAASLAGTAATGEFSFHPWMLAGAALIAVIAKLMGLYDRDQNRVHRATLEEIPALFELATLVTLLSVLAQGAIFGYPLAPAGVATIWMTMLVLLVCGRMLTRSVVDCFAAPERCIIIGDERTTGTVVRTLGYLGANVQIVATAPIEALLELADDGFENNTNGGGAGHAVGEDTRNGIGGLDGGLAAAIRPLADREQPHRVILASGSTSADELVPAVVDLMASGMKVSIVPSTARLTSLSYEVDQLPGMALLGMKKFGISRSSQIIKRTFDVVISSLALIALAPLMTALAVAIRLDSPGPALYRQRRTGKKGREFEILKFRSMVAEAHTQRDELLHLSRESGLFKLDDDPRVTRVGKVIRRYSLDELPQLINVLRGDMSLVGPRPLLPVEDARVQGDFRRRLDVVPGITGHWQVLGSWRVPVEDMVVLDYLYTANWSLWTDLKLLARTFRFVAAGRGI